MILSGQNLLKLISGEKITVSGLPIVGIIPMQNETKRNHEITTVTGIVHIDNDQLIMDEKWKKVNSGIRIGSIGPTIKLTTSPNLKVRVEQGNGGDNWFLIMLVKSIPFDQNNEIEKKIIGAAIRKDKSLI